MYNNEFFQNINVENNITGDNDSINQNMDNTTMMGNNTIPTSNGVKERVINRTFIHEVPQDFPFMIDK